jgi:preprotein translocase subunit YajC
MSLLPAVIWLQEAPPASSPFSMFVPMALIFLIFYLLLIRPQQKQRKEHEAMIQGIEKGDAVVTSGGLHGKVTGVTDDVLTLEVSSFKGEKVRVKQQRSRIETVRKAKKGEEES